MDKNSRQTKANDAAERQKALDNISPEDLAKIKAHQASTQGAYPVDEEWLLLTEFAMAFGWEAYLAAKNDELKMPEMLTLIEASRKLRALEMFENSQTFLIGAFSAKTKRPLDSLRSLTANIRKRMEVK